MENIHTVLRVCLMSRRYYTISVHTPFILFTFSRVRYYISPLTNSLCTRFIFSHPYRSLFYIFFFVPSCSVCSLYLRCAIFHTTSPCVPVSFWLSQKSFFLRFFVSILITPSVKPLYNFYFQLTWTQCGVAVTLSFLFSLITNATYTATCICRHCPFMCMCLRMCITMFIMYT